MNFHYTNAVIGFRRRVFAIAGPEQALLYLYRARVFQKEKEFRDALKRPHVEVGPPPPPLAAAGRMNAAGISVFYAATTPALALAEVLPPVGSKVLIGCFQVIRQLKLLALTDLADGEGSLFDELHVDRLRRAEFLRGLSERLSRPRKAAQVTASDEGEEVFVSDELLGLFDSEALERGPGVEYSVWVSPPNDADTATDAPLKLISIQAHYVTSVRVETEPIKTNRFTREK